MRCNELERAVVVAKHIIARSCFVNSVEPSYFFIQVPRDARERLKILKQKKREKHKKQTTKRSFYMIKTNDKMINVIPKNYNIKCTFFSSPFFYT